MIDEFDHAAAIEAWRASGGESGTRLENFTGGARWQHAQMSGALAAAEREQLEHQGLHGGSQFVKGARFGCEYGRSEAQAELADLRRVSAVMAEALRRTKETLSLEFDYDKANLNFPDVWEALAEYERQVEGKR